MKKILTGTNKNIETIPISAHAIEHNQRVDIRFSLKHTSKIMLNRNLLKFIDKFRNCSSESVEDQTP